MNITNQQEYAQEIKVSRVVTLWRATLVIALGLLWLLISTSLRYRTDLNLWIFSLLVLAAGSLVARSLIHRGHLNLAVWSLVGGGLAAMGCMLATGDPGAVQIVPFIAPLLVFIIGVMLPPRHTFIAAVLAALVSIGVPLAQTGNLDFFQSYQIVAIFLTLMSALIAAQVTGELYEITEWALHHYDRQRQTSSELFESRDALEMSLRRSEALSERLQETNELLDTARRSAEEAKHFRGQFLANMSHELRTPLNAIIGFSETMLRYPEMYDGTALPSAYEADLSQIYTSGRQLLGLINDILDLSKVDAGKLEVHLEAVDLESSIRGAVATAAGLIGERPIELRTDLPEHLPLVWADNARVRQVLLNIYSNAAKFTDHGSITLRVRAQADQVRVSVTDTGSGIPADSLEAIFEEFKQAQGRQRDPRSGAGLGLAISRQLLHLMGGHIWAESEPGKGSTFHFLLQTYHEGLSQPEPQAEPVQRDDSLRVIREPEIVMENQ